MWNDLTIRDPLISRQRPVALLEWNIDPLDAGDRLQVACASKLTNVFKDIPDFQQMKRCLLDAMFFGKSGVQLLFKWDYSLGYKRMIVSDWYPVHGDKIIFKYDRTPGILVNATFQSAGVEYTDRGPAKFLNVVEQDAILIHKFQPEDAGYYRPEAGGMRFGSGMRGVIYWWWWLRQNLQKYLMNFVKKVGNGFLLVGYPTGNKVARLAAQAAVEGQEGNHVIYTPVDYKNGETLDKVIMHVPTNLSGADFQWTIITGINEMIRQYILGEGMSTMAANTGLGSNQGDQHGMTADERVKYDANDLETPMNKLLKLLWKYNAPPGVPCGRYTTLADKRQPQEIMQSVQFALDSGMAVPQSWVQDQMGIPSPLNNEAVLTKVQSMQPTAVGNTPTGTPMAGSSGPAQPPGAPQQGAPQQ
jgi:hypothetical protein